MRRRSILAGAIALPALIGAAPPSALSKIAGGMWEISGAPGTPAPIRQCVTDIQWLAQFEHRNRNCSRSVVSDNGSSAVINYSCGAGDFGRSEIDVVTPRSLNISTQGISDQLPFNYTFQARRVGDCAKNPSSSPH